MADINKDLAAKIDERRRRLDQVDQAIAEMRRLQQEIAPLLRPPTERDPAAPPAPQRQVVTELAAQLQQRTYTPEINVALLKPQAARGVHDRSGLMSALGQKQTFAVH